MKHAIKTYEDFVKTSGGEPEGGMYRPKLEEIAKNATEISNMIQEGEDLEAWVQDKITIAHHNMDAILGYLKSGKKNQPANAPLNGLVNEK